MAFKDVGVYSFDEFLKAEGMENLPVEKSFGEYAKYLRANQDKITEWVKRKYM